MADQRGVATNLELQLFEKIDGRLDDLASDVKDVRERVIRIEAQDVHGELKDLKNRVTALEAWKARIAGQIALIIVPIAATVGALIKILVDLAMK